MKGVQAKEKEVKILRTTHLVVDADRALPIHADGELFAPYEADVRHVEITLVPGAIQVIV
jgi:diacylglycerol kinase family enzyme